jgi:hypothetical protein
MSTSNAPPAALAPIAPNDTAGESRWGATADEVTITLGVFVGQNGNIVQLHWLGQNEIFCNQYINTETAYCVTTDSPKNNSVAKYTACL